MRSLPARLFVGGIALVAAAVSLPALAGPAAPGTSPAAPAPRPEPAPTAEELEYVDLANQERARRGQARLVLDPLLVRAARGHSREMRRLGYFSHTSPTDGCRTPLDRYLRVVPRAPEYACVGENLFYGVKGDVRRGHAALMESPSHRENLLAPDYERIGVGVERGPQGETWVTQMFLGTRDPQAGR